MHKVTVLYNHPADPVAFDEYYFEHHIPLARNMPGVSRVELTKFIPTPSGDLPAFHRMAELYFLSEDQMVETMGTPEGQATIDDLDNFATGGVQIIVGNVESY